MRCTGHMCCNISSDASSGDMYGLLAMRPVFEFSSGLLEYCCNLAYVDRYRSSESRDVTSTWVTGSGWQHIWGIEQLLNIDEHLWLLSLLADLVTTASSASPLGQTTVMSPVRSAGPLRCCSLSLPVSVLAVLKSNATPDVLTELSSTPSSESCSEPPA